MLIAIAALFFTFSSRAQYTTPVDSTLQQFTGKYKFPEGSIVAQVDVVLEEGVLQLISNMGSSGMENRGDDIFYIVEYNGTARFSRDANRKVVGISINAMGYVLEGTRTGSGFAWMLRKPSKDVCR